MMLKKQTVWLLTMLSLVVVLSVYYINGGGQPSNDLANADNEQTDKNTDANKDDQNAGDDGDSEITAVTGDEAFEIIRLQLQDERSKMMEELQTIAGDTELTAEERSEAKDEMEQISEMAEKERLVESLIKSTLGYEDALVRANGEEVSITVKGKEPSKANANQIIQMVRQEMGTAFVTVSYQSGEETK